MQLIEKGLIGTKVENIFHYGNGKIHDIYLIHIDNNAVAFANVEFIIDGKKMYGLFVFDKFQNIQYIPKNICLKYLRYLDKLLKLNIYKAITDHVMNSTKSFEVVECLDNFVIIDDSEVVIENESNSSIIFRNNDKKVECNICLLVHNQSLASCFVSIDKNLIQKEKFSNVDYSSVIDVEINVFGEKYTDFGIVKVTKIKKNCIEYIIEPIETTLLSNKVLNNLSFKNLSPKEMISIMLGDSKVVRLGEIEFSNDYKRTYKYITTIDNFEIESDEVFIGDVILSKKIKDFESKKIKPNSSKYTYVSIQVVADNISIAKEIALKKIVYIKDFIEVIEKNSSIFEFYNKSDELNSWDINKIFIDYKLNDKFYIYNLIDSNQSAQGSNNNFVLRKYGKISDKSQIIKYKDRFEKIVFNYSEKEEKLFNAMNWLNRAIATINTDIYHSIIYINIAIEYTVNGEKSEKLDEVYPELEEIINNINQIIKDSNISHKAQNAISSKFNSAINDGSVNTKFYNMLKRLNIIPSSEQEKSYNLVRKARNDIIHNNKPIDVVQRDLINCYILISKAIIYKALEETNEFI